VFPGCRVPARTRTANRCDLDHRIPYHHNTADCADADGAAGHGSVEGGSVEGGSVEGGRTCSCNLAPLCRTHHQQKTIGALKVRALDPQPGQPIDILQWTLPSGITVLGHPHIAQTRSLADTAAAAGADVATDITAAIQHIADRETRWAAADQARGPRHDIEPDEDRADQAWQQTRNQAAQARAEAAA
jgi:hypothetical protein